MDNKVITSQEVPKLIEKIQREGLYGELNIRFRHGQITSVAMTETYLTEAHFKTGRNQGYERPINSSR